MSGICTEYEIVGEDGIRRYAGQQSCASVKRQILLVLSGVRNAEGTSAAEAMEWIAFHDPGKGLVRPDAPFPKGVPLVAAHEGSNEGWVIDILVRRDGAIVPAASIKYLSDRDLVFEAAKALALAFDEGRYEAAPPPPAEEEPEASGEWMEGPGM